MDCTFYNAIADTLDIPGQKTFPDTLFLQCGGKYCFLTAIKSLDLLKVEMMVVTDFDFLNDSAVVKNIFEALSGEWNNIKDDFEKVRQSISSDKNNG